ACWSYAIEYLNAPCWKSSPSFGATLTSRSLLNGPTPFGWVAYLGCETGTAAGRVVPPSLVTTNRPCASARSRTRLNEDGAPACVARPVSVATTVGGAWSTAWRRRRSTAPTG